jgi:hypothetical protein
MALRTPPSWLQNGSHPAENDRLTTKAIWQTTGIVNPTDLQITQNGGGNMSVNVSSGWAAIVGTTQANMGTYMAYNDASTNLTITTASPSNPRIDLVVITINDAYYTGSLNNVSFQVIAGTPAASPTVPATPANSLALGQIAVGAGVTSILTANITNYGTLATSPFMSKSAVAIGTLTYTPVNALGTFQSSTSSYNQVILQNSNTGTAASADMIVNNNLSTDSTYYGDFGINSSTFTGSGAFNAPNAVYVTATTGDLALGTTTSNPIHFVVNGGATDAMTIATTGAITGNFVSTINAQTGTTYTPALTDANALVTLNNASAISVTIPTNASVAYPVGTQISFAWITGAGQPTISAVTPGTTTILSTGATVASPKLRIANAVASALKIATDSWLVTGDIV